MPSTQLEKFCHTRMIDYKTGVLNPLGVHADSSEFTTAVELHVVGQAEITLYRC